MVMPPLSWGGCLPHMAPQAVWPDARDALPQHMAPPQQQDAPLCHAALDLSRAVDQGSLLSEAAAVHARARVPVELQAMLRQQHAAARAPAKRAAGKPAAEKAPNPTEARPEEPAAAPKASKGSRRPLRSWIHIYLHMQTGGFDLVPRMIGRKGCNLRKIADATGAKIRIRGRGSGHLEGDTRREAPVPLMIAVTADQQDFGGFCTAVEMTLLELSNTAEKFQQFCAREGHACKAPFYSVGMINDVSRELVGGLLDGIPQAPSH